MLHHDSSIGAFVASVDQLPKDRVDGIDELKMLALPVRTG